MFELHNTFLLKLKKYWKDEIHWLSCPEKHEIISGTDIIEKMIRSGSFNINEKDQDGNTLLHLILDTENEYLQDAYYYNSVSYYNKPSYVLLSAALEMGADLSIINRKNLTPIKLYFTKNKHGIDPYFLLFLIRKFNPRDEFIIPVLDGVLNESPDKDFAEFLWFMHELSLDTLKSILIWSDKIRNQKNGDQLKEKLAGQIQLLEKAFDLPAIIEELTNAKDEKRNTLLRAMLLEGETPLVTLLNHIIEQPVFSHLHHDLRSSLNGFIEEYEKKRLLLEELSAIPTALTSSELSIVKPICNSLDFILYNLQEPSSDKEWQKRVEKIEDSPQKRMTDRYTQYQANDRKQRDKLIREIHLYEKPIKNGLYLGKNGIFAKNNQRGKSAEAAEKRIKINKPS